MRVGCPHCERCGGSGRYGPTASGIDIPCPRCLTHGNLRMATLCSECGNEAEQVTGGPDAEWRCRHCAQRPDDLRGPPC
jgi:hypothetical protein